MLNFKKVLLLNATLLFIQLITNNCLAVTHISCHFCICILFSSRFEFWNPPTGAHVHIYTVFFHSHPLVCCLCCRENLNRELMLY